MTYLDKLVDYTINTPHNANAAIVKSLAERYAEEKAGGGSDILETVTISEPNIIYDGVLEANGWSERGQTWECLTPSEIAPFVDGGDYTVIFNGEAFKGTVENGSFDSETNSNGQSFTINPGDGGYIFTSSDLLDSAMDVPLQIINGTIEKEVIKLKKEYIPTWEDLGTGFGTIFEAEGISLDYISEAGSSANMNFTSSIPLITGESYNVTINGETYSNVIAGTIAFNGRNNVILGDKGMVTNGAWTENDYPFTITTPEIGEGAVIALQGEVISCDIKIEGETTIPIPSEYLPAMPMFVTFTDKQYGGQFACSHTYAEVKEALASGNHIIATIHRGLNETIYCCIATAMYVISDEDAIIIAYTSDYGDIFKLYFSAEYCNEVVS